MASSISPMLGTMLRIVVQLTCIAVTALVLFAFHESFLSLRSWFGAGFAIGLISGAAFVGILWALNEHFDGASRHGRTSKQD
ncbi:hypothetical protein E5S70_33820 [Ensifer adhaerens]|uniref:hypothetical protein n=1 Tax=Ensifer canadensis TaxID=555315 RepID=UPI0014907CF1|nr:hypothetical protein [Ensifer canadensis]NOV20939.1 hypothetical protein [Ensifer canadensis]